MVVISHQFKISCKWSYLCNACGYLVCTPHNSHQLKYSHTLEVMTKHGKHSGPRWQKFAIVIHDVMPDDKERLDQYVKTRSPIWYQIALERYGSDVVDPKTEHHLHLFIQFKNQHSKFKLLKELQQLFTGRIQVDQGRGTQEQCLKYLVDPDKDKHTDEEIIHTIGIPKMRCHNHRPTNLHPDSKQCPRCNHLKYMQTLRGQDYLDEIAKPYLDQELYTEYLNDPVKINWL